MDGFVEKILKFTPQRPSHSEKNKEMDGSVVSEKLLGYLSDVTKEMKNSGVTPRLAVVLPEGNDASEIYVKHKVNACQRLDIRSNIHRISGDISQTELRELVADLNNRPDVDGILLQLPLPKQISENRAVNSVEPSKDVDGIHPTNLGKLMSRVSPIEPCTPRGIMTLLRTYGVEPEGKEAVVIGRSRIVGRPMAQMLLRANATITVCHRHTSNLKKHIERADLVVVAAGVPNLVRGDWIKEGAVIVDVGITRKDDGSLVGDVEFGKAKKKASLVTPVPGGVGPMTVATLMQNTVIAAYRNKKEEVNLHGQN